MVLVIGGVLYIAGSNIGSGWVVILTAAMVGALALDLVAVWRSHRGTRVDIRLPASATTAEPADVRLDLVRSDVGTSVQLSDAGGSARVVVRTGQATVRLPLPLARGRHDSLVVVARTVGPLGLVAAVTHHTAGHAACPTPVHVRPGAMPAVGRVRALAGAAGVAQARARGEEDVRGVREFTASDPRRAVHWRATARQGRLMVRETAAAEGASLHLGIAAGVWTARALDLACEVVAGIGLAAAPVGHAVHVLVDGATRPWDDATWHLLATLPPAAGVEPRPLRATDGPGVLWLHPLPADLDADDRVLVEGPGLGRGKVLHTSEEVGRWLRGDA